MPKRYRSSNRDIRRYMRPLGRFGAAAAVGYNAYKKYSNSKVKKQKTTHTGSSVTQQRDSKVQYVRKRMPRWKKRPWVKFVKKVDWISNHRQTHFTLCRHFTYASTSVANAQNIACEQVHFGFYGNSTRINNQIDDWLFNQGLTTTALRKGKKFFISSLTDDYTVKNSGTTDAEVDVYELICIRDLHYSVGTTSGDYPTMEEILAELLSDDKTGTVAGLSTIGVNPFNVASFSRVFKVLKKIKHFLTPGAFFTHQVRTSKDKMYSCDTIIPQADNALTIGQQPGLLMKAYTSRVTLFVHRGEPGFSAGLVSEIGPSQIQVAKVMAIHGAIIDPTQKDTIDN